MIELNPTAPRESWTVRPLKHALNRRRSGGVAIKGSVTGVRGENFVPGYSASGQDVWLSDAKFYGPGIVLSAVGARCGRCFEASGSWGVVANTAVFQPRRGYDNRYLWYVTNVEGIWIRGGSAQPYVVVPESLAQRWPFPSHSEQSQIARFLDYETAKLDALIEKQRQLIELLKEKRQAVISHAVTKGQDPNAPLKDSGVEWLGMVPAHWEVGAMKFFVAVQGGYAFKGELFGADGIPVVRIGDIARTGSVAVSDCKRVPRVRTIGMNAFRVSSGDILMAMTGATVGKVGRVPQGETAFLNQRVGAFRRASKKLKYEFLWYILCTIAYQEYLLLTAEGGAQQNVSDRGMLAYRIAVPPLSEQEKIVEYLLRRLQAMSSLDRAVANQIELLQERRAALISAAVTGKVDVRNWTPVGA